MNRYGRMAYDHTRQHRPKAFASLSDPTEFFSRLGEEAAAQITRLRDDLLGPQRSDESLEDYRRRSNQAQRQAEELVLAETVWLRTEEATPEPTDDQLLAYRARLAGMSQSLAEADRDWTDTAAEATGPP